MITLNAVKSTPKETIAPKNFNLAFSQSSTVFFNNSQYRVVVMDRDNLPTLLNGNDPAAVRENTITVQTKYQYLSHNDFLENLALLESLGARYKMISENHAILKEVFLRHKNDPYNHGSINVTIEHKINLDNLIGKGHVYDPSTDLMVVDAHHWGKFVHPSSPEYEEAVPVNKYLKEKKASGILVEIVDNEQRISKRFFYCAGDVLCVHPHQDSARSDGVYVTKFLNQPNGEITQDGSRVELDKAESVVGLFKTEEDARTNGAPDSLIRQHEAVLRKELVDKTHEIETVKRDSQAQEARLKEEARERDAQLQREEHQRKRMADEYAERQRAEDERRTREENRRKEEADETAHLLFMAKKKAEEDLLESNTRHLAEVQELKTRDLERDATFRARELELKEKASEAERKFKKKVAKAERKAKDKANEIERKAKNKANIADRKAKKQEAKIKKKAAKTALEAKRIAEDINRTSLITKEEYSLRTQELAMQARRRDDYYEERSHQRKDSSELFKWVPTILTAGLAAFSIFKMI